MRTSLAGAEHANFDFAILLTLRLGLACTNRTNAEDRHPDQSDTFADQITLHCQSTSLAECGIGLRAAFRRSETLNFHLISGSETGNRTRNTIQGLLGIV